MKKSDFYFDLPERLIAQHPLEQRDASRLMVLNRTDGSVTHRHFRDLLEYVQPGDCMVFNNSRVIPARLMGHAVGRTTPIEVLLLTDKGDGLWECLTRPGRKTREGVELTFGDGLLTATVEKVQPDGNRLIRFHYEGIFLEILDKLGTMPLPPYIKEKLDDPERYQTVYSKRRDLRQRLRLACILPGNYLQSSSRRVSSWLLSHCTSVWAPSARSKKRRSPTM